MSNITTQAFAIIAAWTVCMPVVLTVFSALMIREPKGLADVCAAGAIVTSWIPLTMGIIMEIGDGNPTVDIVFGAAISAVAVGILVWRWLFLKPTMMER